MTARLLHKRGEDGRIGKMQPLGALCDLMLTGACPAIRQTDMGICVAEAFGQAADLGSLNNMQGLTSLG